MRFYRTKTRFLYLVRRNCDCWYFENNEEIFSGLQVVVKKFYSFYGGWGDNVRFFDLRVIRAFAGRQNFLTPNRLFLFNLLIISILIKLILQNFPPWSSFFLLFPPLFSAQLYLQVRQGMKEKIYLLFFEF